MPEYIIIETDDGLMVVEVPSGKTACEVATILRGTLVDEGPYHSYEDAYDAMCSLPNDDAGRAHLHE